MSELIQDTQTRLVESWQQLEALKGQTKEIAAAKALASSQFVVGCWELAHYADSKFSHVCPAIVYNSAKKSTPILKEIYRAGFDALQLIEAFDFAAHKGGAFRVVDSFKKAIDAIPPVDRKDAIGFLIDYGSAAFAESYAFAFPESETVTLSTVVTELQGISPFNGWNTAKKGKAFDLLLECYQASESKVADLSAIVGSAKASTKAPKQIAHNVTAS